VHAKTSSAQAIKNPATGLYGPSEHYRIADRRHVKWPDRSASIDQEGWTGRHNGALCRDSFSVDGDGLSPAIPQHHVQQYHISVLHQRSAWIVRRECPGGI